MYWNNVTRMLQTDLHWKALFSLLGMIWSECKEIWADGPREYIMHLWNVLDFGMLSIFVASFTARLMAFLRASEAQLYVDMYVPNMPNIDLSNASLPPNVAYYTHGQWHLKNDNNIALSLAILLKKRW